jgi:multidrug efflux pump subunit AcrA (membrane-fusion protein)
MGAKVQLMEVSDTAAGTSVRLLVPKTAILQAPDGPMAFVLDGDRVRTRRVQLGPARGDLVEVGSGLAAGQYVVVKDQDKLRDGQRVRRTN